MIDLCLFLSFFRPDAKTNGFSGCFWCQRIQTVLYQLFFRFVKALHEKVTDPLFYSQSCSHRAEHSKHKPHTQKWSKRNLLPSPVSKQHQIQTVSPCKRHSKRKTVPDSRQSQKETTCAISLTSPPPTAPACIQLPQKAATQAINAPARRILIEGCGIQKAQQNRSGTEIP